MTNIIDRQEIKNKYSKIMHHDTTHLMIETMYHTLDNFFMNESTHYKNLIYGNAHCKNLIKIREANETHESCEINKTIIFLKFLSHLEEFVKEYTKTIAITADGNCAFVHIFLSASIPIVNGYSFSFEETIIHACQFCTSYFTDNFEDLIQIVDGTEDYDTLLKRIIKDFFENVKVMQIKNIDRTKKIKVLCDGNYFVMDQRILINEVDDMRSDYSINQ